jgi:drug/metabolite transporter (DMT)-like permease
MSDRAKTKANTVGIAGLLILSFAHSFFLVSSQVLFKIAEFAPHDGIWDLLWIVASNPIVILSVLSFGGSMVCWWVILKNFDFSLAYPLISLNYVFALAYAVLVLRESIPATRYMGVIAIILGVLVMTIKEEKLKY